MRSLLLALGAGVVLIVLIAATNSVTASARSISEDAGALSRTDETIRAGTVARTLTVLASIAANEGATTPSLDEISDALTILRTDSDPLVVSFRTAVEETVATLETGTTPLPEQVADVENTFGEMLEGQLEEREVLAANLAASENRLNQISSLAGLALLFVVPTVAIGVYRAITRPDVENRALAHAAAETNRSNTNRLSAVADGIGAIRSVLPFGPPTAVTDQRLAEIAALAGVGADGELRRRRPIDARTAAASAVNRVELTEAVPIAGRAPAVLVDEEQFVTMLAALAGTFAGRRAPAITIDHHLDDAVIRLTCADALPVLDHLSRPTLFAERLDELDVQRVIAARALATDLDVRLAPIDDDGRFGYEIRLAATSETPLVSSTPEPVMVQL